MKFDPIVKPLPPGNANSLIRMVDWAHRLLAEVLAPGDLAIDLTAGLGRDTLFLFRQVGLAGRVLAFDIQATALCATAVLLQQAGADVQTHAAEAVPPFSPGVHLLHTSHVLLDRFLLEPPQAVIANLGYLPGGDPTLTTVGKSTLTALEQALRGLAAGGRLAVTVYTGHIGGGAEGEMVSGFFADLSPANWQVLRLQVGNRPVSPYLLVAERR